MKFATACCLGFLVTAYSLAGTAVGQDRAPQNGDRPNIIFLLADDLGYGELGCYGQEWIETPNIDRIATEGMRFTQFYCGQAVCAPSRCSLLTGLHQGHATIRGNGNPAHRGRARPKDLYFPAQHPIPDHEVTIAEQLQQQGYATAAIGKWGLGYEGSSGDPNRQGFDLFYGFICQVHAHNHYPRFLWRNGKKEMQAGNDRTLTGETYSQDQFTDVALQFIRDNKERPFFLYMPFAIPHLSIQAPEDSVEPYLDRIAEEEYKHRGYLQHPHPRAGYAAMISHMDRDIGKILDLVRELGLDDNTIVLFSSDNGPTYNRLGGSDSKFFNSAGPLRGRKGSLWEGGIRVPLVARWPNKIRPGTTTEHIAAFWDLFPTFCDLAGITEPPKTDGISFAPTLLGKEQSQHPHLYWEFPGYGGQQAVRMGRWKAIRQGLHKRPDAPFQLYDLENDLGEQRDVAAEHPEVVESIQAICTAEHTPSELFPFPALDKPADLPVEESSATTERPAPADQTDRAVTDQPNVIVIISDDAGYADFSFQGSEQIRTPHIDSIASGGVRFTQAYVTASVCSPSRAGLMTGRYQQRFGHELNIPARMSQENGLPLDQLTLAEALHRQGYRTIGLGKWHLGYADHFHPQSRGFDDFFGFLQGARSFWPMARPSKLNRLLKDRQPVEEQFDYMTDELGRQAVSYIQQHHRRPFFMYLAFNAVHTPMHARDEDLAEVTADVPAKRKKLIAMTHAMDRAVGKVLAALDEHQIADNTLVIFVNDNGGATNNASTNGTLLGRKGTPFEGGIRVPFAAKWPARWPAGQTYDFPISTLDIFPTAVTAAGGDLSKRSKPLDGVDLTPYVTGNQQGRPHDMLYWRRGNSWAIRVGDWKLARHRRGDPQLFHLAADPGELKNLAGEQRQRVESMTQQYERWNAEMVPAKWSYRNRQ